MTLAIPWLGPDATELRYCLRSLTQHLPITELIIIGSKPPFNCTHIHYRDNRDPKWNHRNVWEKLLLVDHAEFIWSADDCYLMRDYPELPNLATGSLQAEIARRNPTNPYTHTLRNTAALLPAGVLAFNTHFPIHINRDHLREITADWSVPHGYCIKTLYAQGLPCESVQDQKLFGRERPAGDWFSSSPSWMRGIGPQVLGKLWPVPCRWEK